MMELRRQVMTRYISPLREGGSLPALAEADDGFRYVVKFRGAGHGEKALVAELIGGEIARALGLKVPEIILLDIDQDFGRTEADEEIQDLLKWSMGLNVGLHFLNGAVTLDPYAYKMDAATASGMVWLDAFITNIDRTVKNTNMLVWHREPWLIDHGASLYFHHAWTNPEASALSPFPYVKDHALLQRASLLEEADRKAHTTLSTRRIAEIVDLVPDELLGWEGAPGTPDELRAVYRQFLNTRLENSEIFLRHAIEARNRIV